jgi:PAS domain S-box-containing protein
MKTGPPDEIRVLHVDDEPDFADLAATFLEREDDRISVETAASASDAEDTLEERRFDCVVSDYEMPGRNGIEFLESVRSESPELPFILFTGKGSEEVASDAISAGVTDYLQKEGGTDQYAVLANRITNAVEHNRSRRMVERSERRLREIIDSLPHFLYVVDEEGTYLLANEALAEFHDTTVEAIEGAHVSEVLGEPVAEEFLDNLEKVFDSDGETLFPEIEVADPDGDVHVFEPRLLPYEFGAGDTRSALGIAAEVTERKERERELERVRDRMELALEHTNAIIFEIDLETGAVMRHGTYERFFEHAPEELPTWQDHCEGIVHPDDREAFRRLHREMIDGDRTSGDIEYRTDPPDGEGSWIEAHVHVMDEAETEAEHRRALGISRDVTDRKERERELEGTNALLSTLFDTLPVGVLAEDERRNVVAVNDRLLELFGLSDTPEEVRGADCVRLAADVSDIFARPDAFADRIDDVIDGGEPVSGEELRLADGRTYALSYHPIELPEGDGHLWVYTDVTDRKTRETRLEALNETTRELMAADTREAVTEIGVSAAADILGLGANAIHLYDEDREGLVPIAQTDSGEAIVGDPPTLTEGSIAWRAYERGEPVAVDDVRTDPDVYNPDTEVRSEIVLPIGEVGVLIAGSPESAAFEEEDRVLGEILAGNVAAALEQVEQTEQLRARERELERQNERLEEFASVVSHDLRNPLQVAEGRLELLRDETESEQVDAIEGALDRMDALLEDILTLAREGDEVSGMEPVEFGPLCEACWQHVETGTATLEVESDGTIRADRSRLQQLIENLVRNAVEHGSTSPASQTQQDAVERGGEGVTVTVGTLEDGFYVADDGPGIPPEEREAAFEAGYSTAEEGTGFGLSIVEEIAEAHGWSVRIVESEAGGARFEVTAVERPAGERA